MDVAARVSGWTGLPQYESQIPELQLYGTLWESLAIAFLFIAAFVLGQAKRVTVDEAPIWGRLIVSFTIRIVVSAVGVIGFVFLLGVIPMFHAQ